MATITRHGLYGGPRGLYGDFTGKSYSVTPVVAPRIRLEVVNLPMVKMERLSLPVYVRESTDLSKPEQEELDLNA